MIIGKLVAWARRPLIADAAGDVSISGDECYPDGAYRAHNPGGVQHFEVFGVPDHYSRAVDVVGRIDPDDTVALRMTNAAFDDETGFGNVARGATWSPRRAVAAAIVALNGGIYA
jgi:hypothetical protein